MSSCPNCFYKLVLLSHRRKYKCAKCGRLFFQKSIESKDFRQWDKKQKETDLHNFNLELKQRKIRPKLTEEEKLQRRKAYYLKNKDKIREYDKLWRAKNKEHIRAKEMERYYKNRDKINAKRRERYAKNKEHLKAIKRAIRHKNIELTRLQSRIDYWKQQQKVLADTMLKFKQEEAYNTFLTHSVPTFLHCELLQNP